MFSLFRYSYLTKQEWDIMTARYTYDHSVTVTKATNQDNETRFITSPGIYTDKQTNKYMANALHAVELMYSIPSFRSFEKITLCHSVFASQFCLLAKVFFVCVIFDI